MIQFTQLWPLLLLLIPIALLVLRFRGFRLLTIPDRVSVALRMIAIALVIVAMSGPQLLSWVDAHNIYFVADFSKSVRPDEDRSELINQINALAVPQNNTNYGLIVFGERPYVESSFNPTLNVNEVLSNVEDEGTDLAAALDLAITTFPADGKKTIVLMSDGQSNNTNIAESLGRAKRAGIEIYTIPQYPSSAEFLIQNLQTPQEVAVEFPFSFQNVVYALRSGTGQLYVYRNEELISTEEIQLSSGLNYIVHNDELAEPGVYEYRTELIVDGDTLAENNVYRALVEGVGDPRILLVEASASSQPSVMENLLSSSGYEFTKTTLAELAPTASSLLSYRAVILNDVALRDITFRQIEHLENYVRDLGGGLFLVQGREAVAEFYDREFERILPIQYEGPEELQRPALALVMLLDRSGSMGESAGEHLKIDLLQQAALEAVAKIEPNSMVGIIGFDSRYDWLVELETVEGRTEEIRESISKLYPNGGTDVYQALRDAVIQLNQVQARVKHILLFSDGKVSQEGRDFQAVFQDIADTTISASAIAIGGQADLDFLGVLADIGRGEMYPVEDARDLPRITLEEMVRLEKARWILGPLGVEPGPFAYEFSGTDPTAIPDVDGYVLTYEKPATQTLLRVRAADDHTDPLVSHWRYGLGEVFVLNTSFEGEGVERWKEWPELSDLTTDILGQVYSESSLQPGELTVWTDYENSELTVHIEAASEGQWLDLLPLEGQLNSPEGDVVPLEISQIGPGSYEARVDSLSEGVYLLNVGEESIGNVKEAIHIPYAAEFQRIGLNDQVLQQASSITGGQYLENPAQLQQFLEGRTQSYRDIWPTLILIALGFFMLDLIARKIPMPVAS